MLDYSKRVGDRKRFNRVGDRKRKMVRRE